MTDIGGDYFDYFLQDGNLLFGLVGDVSGHGVSAALIMGMAKHAFASSTSGDINLVETLSSFNKFLLSNIKRKKMMTLFFYCVNLDTNELEYANAGHNYPLWYHRSSKNVDCIEMDSFPLGIRAKATYKSKKISMEKGDCLLMYTDGLIEATNAAGEVLGFDNAMEWFKSVSHMPIRESISELFELFDNATDGLPAEDDISLIILKRN
jgi:sigma-B regulation protein RsbU (phosphoserine phosphatase)